MRFALVVVVALAGWAVVAPQPARGFETHDTRLWSVERNLIALTNHQRSKHSLPPLKIDPRLVDSARKHAFWMTRSQSLQHTMASVGENIAMGQRTSAEAVRAWMESPGHRANMLSGEFRRIGAAAYRTPDGTIYWCLQFLR